MRRLSDSVWPWMALVALLSVPLFLGLDRQDLDNDEAIYSFSVEAMVQSGDWLTPRGIYDQTSPFLEKPPLKIWMVALPIHWGLLPANEFGMRIWDAVMSSLALLYVFAIGRRLAGPVCGVTAVVLLMAHHPLIFQHGLRTNNMEAAVFLSYAAGVYHFLAWRTSAPDARGHLVAIALAFVLGFMTKFVAALFLPAILAVAFLLKAEERQRVRLYWRGFALAGLIAAALIAPWFVYQYIAHRSELSETMFGVHVLRRLTVYLDPSHVKPWSFYFTEMWRHLVSNGSAAVTAIGAAALVLNTVRRRWLEGVVIILWFVIPLAVISAGTSKLYHYAYPFLPPVALAGGYAIALLVRLARQGLQRPVRAVVGVAAALALMAVPLTACYTTVIRARETARPLQDVRACLSRMVAASAELGHPPPGVWVESGNLSHVYFYYLRGLGPWQKRDVASDTTVAMHLFVPSLHRPVLLSHRRYGELMNHVEQDLPGLLTLAARKAEVNPAPDAEFARQAVFGVEAFYGEILVMPGQYGACASRRAAIARR